MRSLASLQNSSGYGHNCHRHCHHYVHHNNHDDDNDNNERQQPGS